MTVIGMRTKPADARAIAPVVRFARFVNLGSDELEGEVEVDTSDFFATFCLNVLRDVKYNAEPKLVLMIEGSVPRHSCWTALGPRRMSFKVVVRELAVDC